MAVECVRWDTGRMSGSHVEVAALDGATPDFARGPGGQRVPLTVQEPDTVARGGIVVLQGAHEAAEAVQHLQEALAGEGWVAVAPHLYHRHQGGGDSADELDAEMVLEDCDATFSWLAARGIDADRTGVMGFDLGGSVALMVASSRQIGAAVTVAGAGIDQPLSRGLPTLLDLAPSLACPWLGLYGQDEGITVEQVEALRDAAATSLVATNLVTYDGAGHRFDSADADSEALQRVFDWFDSHLR